LLAAIVLILGNSVGTVSADPPEVDPSRLADELKFRHDFGLATDPAFVAELIASPGSDSRWGVSLTPAEHDEMDRRAELESKMRGMELRAEGMANFAGHWIDQERGGVVTVAFVEGAERNRPALEALLPEGADLRVINVANSLQDLASLEERVAAEHKELWAIGVDIRLWGVDISENKLRIGVANLRDADIMELNRRYGEGRITVMEADPEPTACTSRESCYGPPLRAGISGAPRNVALNNRCSIAFLVHAGSAVQWLTAGHCAKTVAPSGAVCGTTSVAYCWYHAGNGSWPIGQIKKTCWPNCLYSDSARGGNINSTYASNSVWLNYLGARRNVSASQALGADDEGDMTCLNARKSEAYTRCGYISWKGTWTYPGGIYFEDLRFATYAHKVGDSGGAVHSGPTASFTVVAYGVHSGCTGSVSSSSNCTGYSIYSHIARVNQELGTSVCTTANPCP
jgi:hypothetical protein